LQLSHWHSAKPDNWTKVRLYNTDIDALMWNMNHRCGIVAAMRYHGAILATLTRSQLIGLEESETAKSQKLLQVFRILGVESCWFPVSRPPSSREWSDCVSREASSVNKYVNGQSEVTARHHAIQQTMQQTFDEVMIRIEGAASRLRITLRATQPS
jgi:polysaccharide pyruvyl transferase WcaK-like protein